MTPRILSILLLTASVYCLGDVTTQDAETSRLWRLFDEQWNREMALNPTWASMLGDKRFNTKWSDLSQDGRIARRASDVTALQRLRKIDRELLPDQEKVNYDLFQRRYEDRIESHPFNMDLIPISQRGGIQTLDELARNLELVSRQDFEDWLARLEKLDVLMAQTIELMRTGMATGIMPPKVTMSRVPNQIDKQLVSDPVDSLFYQPFKIMPADLSSDEQEQLRQRARSVIEHTVLPAYQRLQSFFIKEYLPACRDSIAAADLPRGRPYYEHLVRRFTTTDLTPDEVHKTGLQEVSRIRKAMNEVIKETGFQGSFQEFLSFLRNDPQFYYATPDALLEGYLAIAKKIDPLMPKLFTRLPRMPYGVKPIPAAIAPDTTTAYYMRPSADGLRAGYYYVNLYRPETRPKYEMEVLTVHEAVPGHHMQIALQQELERLPAFRRFSGYTAFIEGWGLYSERLGYDIGLYEDPYSSFGQLTYDMWRAVRLVVDTGMHYKGWSRQEAIDFFTENAAKSKLDIINEVDRYISWPGQALAYKLGQLKFSELRARSEQTLGPHFDLRKFHDRVLENGAVPLKLLEADIDAWLAAEIQSRSFDTGL